MAASPQHNSDITGGSAKPESPEPRHLVVALVGRPHGVRGEVRAKIVTAHPDLLETHSSFFLASPEAPDDGRDYTVERIRLHSGAALLKLAGCEDRDAAAALRGMLVQVPIENAVGLDEGEYYQHQVIGLEVETEDGEPLGRLVEVLETGANDVYIVLGPRGELLIPALSAVVQRIDLHEGRMTIHPLPGLLPEE